MTDELWVTKEGVAIEVKDLNEHHARNILRMLIKQIVRGDLYRLGRHQDEICKARFAKLMGGVSADNIHEEQLCLG